MSDFDERPIRSQQKVDELRREDTIQRMSVDPIAHTVSLLIRRAAFARRGSERERAILDGTAEILDLVDEVAARGLPQLSYALSRIERIQARHACPGTLCEADEYELEMLQLYLSAVVRARRRIRVDPSPASGVKP